jgi:hypothetical protein
MSVEIVLDSTEENIILKALTQYCKVKNLIYNTKSIIVGSIDTGLIKITIEGKNIEENKIPGYGVYEQFVLSTKNANSNQTALLALLHLFYNVGVTYSIGNNKIFYFFADGYTPFYVKKNKFSTYINNFTPLLGKKLVSTNPLLQIVLKAYPTTSVKKYENYNLWYIDSRSSAVIFLRELQLLLDEGYFYPNIEDTVLQNKVITLFNFSEIGSDSKKEDHNYIYKEIKGTKAIRGPILAGNRLDEIFFTGCVTDIKMGITPIVTVTVNFPCYRRTLAGCILSYLNTGYFKLSMLSKIYVYPEDDLKGWISLPVKNFNILQEIINKCHIKNITTFNVSSFEEGIRYHLQLVDSLLLKDNNGYFIAIEGYEGIEIEKIVLNKEISHMEMERYKRNYSGIRVRK